MLYAEYMVKVKERLITDEVTRNQGGTIASRYSRLESRREAVKKINEMFDTNIEVNYREDYQAIDSELKTNSSDTLNDDDYFVDARGIQRKKGGD